MSTKWMAFPKVVPLAASTGLRGGIVVPGGHFSVIYNINILNKGDMYSKKQMVKDDKSKLSLA